MSSTERVKKHRREREAAGFIRYDVWIRDGQQGKVKTFIEKLNRKAMKKHYLSAVETGQDKKRGKYNMK